MTKQANLRPMTQATIHQAKTHLSKLIRKALKGEEVIIANRDKPLVRLQVIEPPKGKRRMGWAKGAGDLHFTRFRC